MNYFCEFWIKNGSSGSSPGKIRIMGFESEKTCANHASTSFHILLSIFVHCTYCTFYIIWSMHVFSHVKSFAFSACLTGATNSVTHHPPVRKKLIEHPVIRWKLAEMTRQVRSLPFLRLWRAWKLAKLETLTFRTCQVEGIHHWLENMTFQLCKQKAWHSSWPLCEENVSCRRHLHRFWNKSLGGLLFLHFSSDTLKQFKKIGQQCSLSSSWSSTEVWARWGCQRTRLYCSPLLPPLSPSQSFHCFSDSWIILLLFFSDVSVIQESMCFWFTVQFFLHRFSSDSRRSRFSRRATFAPWVQAMTTLGGPIALMKARQPDSWVTRVTLCKILYDK